jgi:hypothetical protein
VIHPHSRKKVRVVSLHRKSHEQASDTPHIDSDKRRPQEYEDPISQSPNYARFDFAQNYFSGIQSALSEMIDMWRKRRSRSK